MLLCPLRFLARVFKKRTDIVVHRRRVWRFDECHLGVEYCCEEMLYKVHAEGDCTDVEASTALNTAAGDRAPS